MLVPITLQVPVGPLRLIVFSSHLSFFDENDSDANLIRLEIWRR